jgi:KDEL-tailed cysteine endopeptidase
MLRNFKIIVLLIFLELITCSVFHLPHHPTKAIMREHIDSPPSEAFKVWRYIHKKEYSIDSKEGIMRFENFKKNLEIVKSHNAEGSKNYSIGLNNFADLTIGEFKQKYLTGNNVLFQSFAKEIKQPNEKVNFFDMDIPEDQEDEYISLFLKDKRENNFKSNFKKDQLKSSSVFSTVDWIEKAGLNKKVEDQQECGSCWAFATSQAVSAALTIKTGKEARLSKQQLVDCETKSSGCDGGLVHTAMDYIKINGLASEEDYPYTGVKGQCHIPKKTITKISSFESCVEDEKCANDESLYSFLAKGPVAAVVDASEEFMLYEDGVFDKPCKEANHAILLVGYHKSDKDSESSYWVVKNSWGIYWGHLGYIKIKQSKDYNSCLLNSYYVRPEI